jgi:hypothetical protein
MAREEAEQHGRRCIAAEKKMLIDYTSKRFIGCRPIEQAVNGRWRMSDAHG